MVISLVPRAVITLRLAAKVKFKALGLCPKPQLLYR